MKKKNQPVKTTGIMLICVILSACVGILLLCGAYILPTERIDENVRRSAEVFEREGSYPSVVSWCTSLLDNFTDAYMLLEAADQSEGSVLERALTNAPGITGSDPCKVLIAHYVEGKPLPESDGYPRYWHGYQIWLKPLLSVMTYQGIRIFNLVFQAGLVILTGFLLYRKKLSRIILPFFLTYLMLMPAALARSLQYSACFDVSVLALIAMLLIRNRDRQLYVFLFAGIGTAFFDLSSYPVLTFGMPAVMYFTLNPPKNVKETIKRFVMIGMCWVLGFAGMWVLKWTAATLLTGRNAFSDALSQVRVRTSNLHQDEVTEVSYIECAFRNVQWFVRTPATVAIVLFCVWNLLPFGKKVGTAYLPALPYLLIALVPFAWFALTINHSYMHILFVCKTLGGSVFAMMAWFTGLSAKTRFFRKKTETNS